MIHAPLHTIRESDSHPQQASVGQHLEAIAVLCERRGLRFTPARRRVLRLLAEASKPLKAYAILESIRRDAPSTAPTSVYRVLEFLPRQGWAVKLNSINAFLLRPPGPAWSCTFLVCEQCGSVETLHGQALRSGLMTDAHIAGFTPASNTLEVSGTCARCKKTHRPVK